MLSKYIFATFIALLPMSLFVACNDDDTNEDGGSHDHDHDGGMHEEDDHMNHDMNDDTCAGLDVDVYEDAISKMVAGFQISLSAIPAPLEVGLSDFSVMIMDHSMDNETDLGDIDSVRLVPFMPAHDHGPTPMVLEDLTLSSDNNTLSFEGVDLFMPGCWKLDVELMIGDTTEVTSFVFDIES